MRQFALHFCVTSCAIVLCAAAPSNVQTKPSRITTTAPATRPYKNSIGNILVRELFQEAWLIAQRDELGQQTRDPEFREPPAAAQPRLDPMTINRRGVDLRAHRSGGEHAGEGGVSDRWEAFVPIGSWENYNEFIEKAEILSRGEFVDVLKTFGVKGQPNARHQGPVAVPPEIGKSLGEMNVCAQYSAIRSAHDLIRTKGESPELLDVLVRGYANLGHLTQHFWNCTSQAGQARALLYAQRMVAASTGDTDAAKAAHKVALWHRAYALALAGFQGAALADIDAASELTDKSAPAAPPWIVAIAAYCRYQTVKLGEIAENDPDQKQLAMFLCFLTIEHSRSPSILNDFGRFALQTSPDNTRVIEAMFAKSGVSAGHVLAPYGLESSRHMLAPRLRAIPSLPKEVADALAKASRQQFSPSSSAEVAAALVQAEQKDSGEPSWAMLGRMIQEIDYLDVQRLTMFKARWLDVETDETVRHYWPMVREHPYAALIRVYAVRHPSPAQRAEMLRDLRVESPQMKMMHLLSELITARIPPAQGMLGGVDTIPDPGGSTFSLKDPDQWGRLVYHYADDNTIDLETPAASPNADLTEMSIQQLRKYTPHHPLVLARDIERDWPSVANRLAEIEENEAQHPTISGALGRHFSDTKDWAQAEKFLRLYIAKAPDRWAFEKLAENYLAQNDEANWLKTMEAFLNEKDYGLDHANVNRAIAVHFMQHGDYKSAKPYADAAAQSWASFGLTTAAECEEGLRNWDAAELWLRRNAQRYQSGSSWFEWCKRTGHGDVKAAQEVAAATMGDPPSAAAMQQMTREQLASWAMYCMLSDDAKSAEKYLSVEAQRFKDGWAALHSALLRDAAGDAAGRDAILNEAVKRGGQYKQMLQLVALLRDACAAGGKVDLAALDRILADVPTKKEQGNLAYFAGRYLARHGAKEDAVKYLKQAAQPETAGLMNRTLAWMELRALGFDPAGQPAEP